jgi:hypothetical protein
MIELIIRFIDLLLVALLVGTMFGVWLLFNPVGLSPGFYVELHQHGIRTLNTPMPILGAVCTLLTIVLAILDRGNHAVCYMLVATVVCLVVGGVITRFLNQPINSQVMTWSIQAPPSNWTELRDQWWQWHIVRMLAGIGAMSLLILATLVGNRGT